MYHLSSGKREYDYQSFNAEYGKIGSNLNQIARRLNEYHTPYLQLAAELQNTATNLETLKFEILQKVGDTLGNIQTYQL